MGRAVAVVQARVGSTRLPGKVLRPLGGRPVLSWVLRAAQASEQVDEVVLATTDLPEDDPLAELAAAQGAGVVRGPVDDVLARYVVALHEHPAEAVVRLTADCPLVDPVLVDLVVAAWRAAPSQPYVSTTVVRTLPRGLDVELVSAAALAELDARATGYDRVHVTSAVHAPDSPHARTGVVVAPPADDLRVTLDTPEDLDLLEGLVGVLGDAPPRWQDVVAALRERPDLVQRNAGVRQKAVEEG